MPEHDYGKPIDVRVVDITVYKEQTDEEHHTLAALNRLLGIPLTTTLFAVKRTAHHVMLFKWMTKLMSQRWQ